MKTRKTRVLRKDGIGRDENKKVYTIWRNIFLRCTDPSHKYYEYYGGSGVTMCSEWQDHEAFRSWYLEHNIDGWQLDKDIKPFSRGTHTKEYSPENCCFIPSYINQWFGRTIKLPRMERRGSKFVMSTSSTINGVRTKTYISSDSEKGLLEIYFNFKDQHIRELLYRMMTELEDMTENVKSYYTMMNDDVLTFLGEFNTEQFLSQ